MNEHDLRLLPLGTSGFNALRDFGQIYVDKTDMIYQLAIQRRKFFLTRPRRFGKSLLVSTFASLFTYGLRYFSGLKIEKLWKDTNSYSVVHLDFSLAAYFIGLDDFRKSFNSLLISAFKSFGFSYETNSSEPLLSQLSSWLDTQPVNSIVLLIDEYDAPLTRCLEDRELFIVVRQELSNFFSAIKSNDAQIRFMFLTGITNFNKECLFSDLNDLSDLTLEPAYGSLLGFSLEEVKTYFKSYIEKTGETLGIELDCLMNELIDRYDGFCFEESATQKVFAPWSLLSFLSFPTNSFKGYWFQSGGSPSSLARSVKTKILKNPEEFDRKQPIPLTTLSNSSDVDSLTDVGLLTQTGYLTIKTIVDNTAFVNYPNKEVKIAMAQLYLEQLLGGRLPGQVGCDLIEKALFTEEPESFVQILNQLFKSIDYVNYPVVDEASLRAYVQVYFASADLNPKVEVDGSGLEVNAGSRKWLIEFKVIHKEENANHKLKEAVDQMIEKDYGTQYNNLIRIALVFSTAKKQFVKWSSILEHL